MISTGSIVGIVLGSLALASLLVVTLIRCLKRGQRPLTVTHHKSRNVVTEKPSNVKPDILVTIPSVNTTTTVIPRSAPTPAAPKPKPNPATSYTPKNNYKSSSSSGNRSGGGYTS